MKGVIAIINLIFVFSVFAQTKDVLITTVAKACYDSVVFDIGEEKSEKFSGYVMNDNDVELYSGHFKNGLKDGMHHKIIRDIKYEEISNYKDGIEHGYFEVKIEGIIYRSKNYEDGVLSGVYYRKILRTDTVIIEKYKNGLLHGDSAYVFISAGDTIDLYSYDMGEITSFMRYTPKIIVTINKKDNLSYQELNERSDFLLELAKTNFNLSDMDVDTVIIDTLKIISFNLVAAIDQYLSIDMRNSTSNMLTPEMINRLRVGKIDNHTLWIENVLASDNYGNVKEYGIFPIRIKNK